MFRILSRLPIICDRADAAPSLLIGHSLGGAAVLAAAPHVPEATGVVTIGAPASAAHVTHNFAADLAEINEKGAAKVTLGERSFTITKQFLDDVAGQNLLDGLATLKKALLVCHAPRDEYVAIDNATQIFVAARHSKSFLSLDTAGHLLRKREDAIYLADVIAAWSSRYLPVAEELDFCRQVRSRCVRRAQDLWCSACERGTMCFLLMSLSRPAATTPAVYSTIFSQPSAPAPR